MVSGLRHAATVSPRKRSPSHATVRRIASSDHLLQRIMPNISIHSEGLPSHGPLLTDPHGRIDELLAHHDARLQTRLDALGHGPQTAYAIASRRSLIVMIPSTTGGSSVKRWLIWSCSR